MAALFISDIKFKFLFPEFHPNLLLLFSSVMTLTVVYTQRTLSMTITSSPGCYSAELSILEFFNHFFSDVSLFSYVSQICALLLSSFSFSPNGRMISRICPASGKAFTSGCKKKKKVVRILEDPRSNPLNSTTAWANILVQKSLLYQVCF